MTDTTQLALLLPFETVDPDAHHRAVVRDTIETTAALNHGHVSSNQVRARLRTTGVDVPSHVVGQVYAQLRREGRLVEAGSERSTDTQSGNGGRLIPTYTWVTP